MRRALEIDPISHNFLADLGQMHYFAREYDEAESYCRKALEIYPDFVFAHQYLIDIYLTKGEYDKAFEEEMKNSKAYIRPILGWEEIIAQRLAVEREEYRKGGYKGRYRQIIENLRHRKTDVLIYSALLKYYAVLGEKEKALESLEKSFENHEFMLPFVNTDPLYDDLRAEPRFRAVIRLMGLAN